MLQKAAIGQSATLWTRFERSSTSGGGGEQRASRTFPTRALQADTSRFCMLAAQLLLCSTLAAAALRSPSLPSIVLPCVRDVPGRRCAPLRLQTSVAHTQFAVNRFPWRGPMPSDGGWVSIVQRLAFFLFKAVRSILVPKAESTSSALRPEQWECNDVECVADRHSRHPPSAVNSEHMVRWRKYTTINTHTTDLTRRADAAIERLYRRQKWESYCAFPKAVVCGHSAENTNREQR